MIFAVKEADFLIFQIDIMIIEGCECLLFGNDLFQ